MKAVGLVVLVFFMIMIYGTYRPLDNTDNLVTGERSGFSLYHDYGTGCQYLVLRSFFGNEMTPRLRPDGTPMCQVIRP